MKIEMQQKNEHNFNLSPVEARRILIEELRSGRKRQGRNRLATRDASKHVRYCCLGVACELFNEYEEKIRLNSCKGSVIQYLEKTEDGNKSVVTCLPTKVQQWLAFGTIDGALITPEITAHGTIRWPTLSELNDRGSGFKDIANIIEKELVLTGCS